jgi:hypothetical protein
MPTFATPGPIAATVQVAGARVRVTASDRTDTVVLVEPINGVSRSHVKVASKTTVDFADGQLSVKTITPGHKNGSVAITIDLPAGSSLVAYLAHSGVHADGLFGECELHMASGRVQLDRVDALQASIASGEVAIGHIAVSARVTQSATIEANCPGTFPGRSDQPLGRSAPQARPGGAPPRAAMRTALRPPRMSRAQAATAHTRARPHGVCGSFRRRRSGRRSRPCALLPCGDDVSASRAGKDGLPRRGRLGPHAAAQSLAAVPRAAVPPLAARARHRTGPGGGPGWWRSR